MSAEPRERPPPRVKGVLYGGPAAQPEFSGRRRSRPRRAAYALLAPLLRGIALGLRRTWRFEPDPAGEEPLARALAGGPVVLAMWHEQLVPGVLHLLERFQAADRPLAFLVSPSVDGDLVARILERSGARIARGSATRSGVKALRELHRLMKREGASPLILLDGPQGPPRRAKAGALLLAQVASVPLVPLAVVPRRSLPLPTWDRLRLPLPATRLRLAIGPPRAVPPGATSAELEHLRAELEAELDALTRRAARRGPDPAPLRGSAGAGRS